MMLFENGSVKKMTGADFAAQETQFLEGEAVEPVGSSTANFIK